MVSLITTEELKELRDGLLNEKPKSTAVTETKTEVPKKPRRKVKVPRLPREVASTVTAKADQVSAEVNERLSKLTVWPILWGVFALIGYMLTGMFAMVGAGWMGPVLFLVIMSIIALMGWRSRSEKSDLQRLERFSFWPVLLFTAVSLGVWIVANLSGVFLAANPITWIFFAVGLTSLAAFTFRVMHGKGGLWTWITFAGGVGLVLLLAFWGNYMVYCSAYPDQPLCS